jgi:hypothetical protein
MRKEEIEERENRNAETILLDWIGLLGKAHYKLLNPNKNKTRTKIPWLVVMDSFFFCT